MFEINRVSLLPCRWHHIPIKTNLVDLVSRSINQVDFLPSDLRWNGSPLLSKSPCARTSTQDSTRTLSSIYVNYISNCRVGVTTFLSVLSGQFYITNCRKSSKSRYKSLCFLQEALCSCSSAVQKQVPENDYITTIHYHRH